MLTLFRPPAVLSLFCAIALFNGQVLSARAQAVTGLGRPGVTPSNISPPRTYLTTLDEQDLVFNTGGFIPRVRAGQESVCFLPPLTGVHTETVGVADLRAQSQARKDFEKSCRALAERKYDLAERQLRAAAEKYPGYPAFWVLLGQLLEKRQELGGARESCLRAVSANSSYVPAYLCLADIAAHVPDWSEVLKESDVALALDPASNRLSYLYNAGANLNLNHLAQAEKNALKAAEIDQTHSDPRLHFLLAQIYEKKGDLTNETAQLREVLKLATQPTEIDAIKQYLAVVEKEASQITK
jgi:predicted Zn-dependent protease